MSKKYRLGRHEKKRHYVVVFVVLACFGLFAAAGFAVFKDLQANSSATVEGNTRTVGQTLGAASAKKLAVDEPTFTMELPGDWKLKSRTTTAAERSITWQGTAKGQDNRWLTVYIDTIPATKSLNRLLPVSAQGDMLNPGDMSDNCITFTGGGSLDAAKASQTKESPAKWAGVDFICNLPSVVENQVGTGSVEGRNQVTVKGPSQGAHKYFFLFTDHNIQPNYSILTDAIESFRAK
jgi:hypothetical protein